MGSFQSGRSLNETIIYKIILSEAWIQNEQIHN